MAQLLNINLAFYLLYWPMDKLLTYTTNQLPPHFLGLQYMYMHNYLLFPNKWKNKRDDIDELELHWNMVYEGDKLEDHWSCIAHLSAEDMLKSAVIEKKEFKHRVGTDNPLGTKIWCHQEGHITMVICCKFKNYLFNLWLYTHLFMI